MGKTRYIYRHGKRILVETLTPTAAPARGKKRKPFKVAWFKFPGWWVSALRNASASAHQLALIILAEAFKREHVEGDIVLSAEVTKHPATSGERTSHARFDCN